MKRVIGAFEWDHPAQVGTLRRLFGLETNLESQAGAAIKAGRQFLAPLDGSRRQLLFYYSIE